MQRKEKVIYMNRNRKLIASLVGIVALTNTVMPVCAKPSDTLVHANVTSINEGKKEKEQGNINLLDPSVGLVSNSNNMNNNGFPYLIQPGDTLSSIAEKNNTTVEKLMETTGLTDPNKIKAGDILVSPYITEEFVLSKGQDPKQNEKHYKEIGVTKRKLSASEKEILRSLFNAEEYAKMYPDVAEVCDPSFGNAYPLEEQLFYHFINWGIWEGRQPSESFSVAAYASAYSDLRKSFGSHIVEYYKHYYNTTVIGNENRTITTVQKAQDAGIKVTDFSGNTVAVDEAGNIVTGEKADKIAAEKNLGTPIGPVIMPTPKVSVIADFNKETEKEETQAPSSEDKKEPSAPVTPTKTFAEAYKEWLASEPIGGSGNVYMVWYAKEPNLADYADGRAFLAKKEAWEKEMPDYDAYLATTAYASDYEEWQANEPKLADYTILVGTDTAENKYNEDFTKWQGLAPKPEDYIQYTSFEADYNAWLAAAPVPVEGKYETAEKAMEAYTEAHSAWEANKPKQSDYFDEESYNQAVEDWNEKAPKKDDYCDPEGYAAAVAKYERENPKPDKSTFFNENLYQAACEKHEAEKPQFKDYFNQSSYETDCSNYDEAMGGYKERKEDYDAQKAAYDTYLTAKAEYDAAYSKWKEDNAEFFEIEEKNKTRREEYEAALAEYNKYIAYKNWEEATLEDYIASGKIIVEEKNGKVYYCFQYSAGAWNKDEDKQYIFKLVHNANKPEYYDTSNPVEAPEEPTYEQLPEGVIDPGEFTQKEPQVVEDPGEFTETPPVAPSEADYAYNGATDRKTADYLYGVAYGEWVESTPSSDDDEFYEGYAEALANWEASYPKETDYYNSTKYDSLDAAKEAYEKAVADHEAVKPSEQAYVKESAGDATDKASALKAFEDATASYTEENPEPTKEEYTSNVMTDEEKAEYDKAVEDYNDAEPSETDSKYVEEAKETEEYKDVVAKHEADKPDQSTYVDDKYADDAAAESAFNSDHSTWEGEKPSEDSYIADTTYAEDLGAWEESEPDFNEYFGIEVAE